MSSRQGDADHLASLLTGAMDWIVRNLPNFDPFAAGAFVAEKARPLGELAIMLHTYALVTGDTDSPGVVRLNQFLLGVRSRPEFCRLLSHHPEQLTLCCHIDTAVRLFGHSDLRYRQQIRRALDAGVARAVPADTEHLMDLRMALERAGLPCSAPSWTQLCRATVLAELPDTINADNATGYRLTHAILFATGFGTGTAALPIVAVSPRLRRHVETLLVAYTQERHWDLVGELLLCWDCLGWGATRVIQRAWRAFASAHDPDGFVPFSADIRAECAPDGNGAAVFAHRYHATLVSVMALAVRMRAVRGGQVPTQVFVAEGRRQPDGLMIDVRSAVARVGSWSVQALHEAAAEAAPNAARLLRLLIVCWVCHGLAPDRQDRFPSLARAVQRTLPVGAEPGRDAEGTAPATVQLVAAAVLRRYGCAATVLDAFVHHCAEVLDADLRPDPLTALVLDEKRLLLHMLRLHAMPRPISNQAMRESLRALELPASAEDLGRLLLHVNSWTLWGMRAAPCVAVRAETSKLLGGLAVHWLSAEYLALGCRVVRSLAYLAPKDPILASAVTYVLHQQDADGGFGGAAAGAATRTLMTLECVLALAEACPARWRLSASLSHQ